MDDVIINRMISITREAIQWYMLEQVCYIFEMYEHDDNERSIIEEESLEGIISGLTEHYGVTEENIEGYRTVADGVSDIISLYTKSPDDMGNAYAGLKEKVEKTKDIFGEYLQKFQGRSGKLAEYIRESYNIVSQCSNSDISMTEYDGAYADIPGVEALFSARDKLIADIGYTDEEIAGACEKSEEITTAYIRQKQGEAKILCLGGIIIGGISLLCPLAMTFTMPQLVVTCSISSICVVYNTDQFLQGMQLLDAAETRNTDAEIDKIVDFHNETLNRGYEIIGKISTAYCGTLVMGTLIQGLGGESVTFASATKETGEDLLTDYMAGNIDEALGGGSPLGGILISSVLSVATNRIKGGGGKGAVDAIDATDVRNVVNDIDATDVTSGKYSLMGEMTDADGKAYERFLREGPQEGLTQTEIMGISKADKQTALNARSQYTVSGKGIETSYGKSSLNLLKNTENFTDSAIEHIFEGNVRRGKAGGYHYEGIEGTSGKIIPGTESSVNNFGVYKAQVEVNGIPKTANGGFSTFYSKDMSPQQVVDAINEAYKNRVYIRGNKYLGVTSSGVEIEMFLDKGGKIISAYPIF